MITYQLLEAGFCRHCERMTLKTGHIRQREYPSICALITHPQHGYILFDTGYTQRFFDLTKKFPFSLYRYLTPVTLQKSLKEQLLEQGISPDDIHYIVISHFHADHIGGLRDFPNARFICHKEGMDEIKQRRGIRGLLKGFLPGLLPSDFFDRLMLLDKNHIDLNPDLYPFFTGFDLFGDGQIIAIPLPGHAKGHIGLYLKAAKEAFLIADSCWHQETFQSLDFPSHLTYLIHDNKDAYIQTIKNIHALHKNNKSIDIIPSHCSHMRHIVGRKTSC